MPADVATTLAGWLSTSGSNAPSGSTSVSTNLDDNLREMQGVVVRGLSHKGADIASAATTDIGAVEGLMHDITGTTTITSFGTVREGILKILKFEGALTLTHNATSLILPGGTSILTVDGDIGIFISEGSGNWRCVSYTPVGRGQPAGIISPYAGTAAPSGWLLCFGQSLLRTDYAGLFATIGTTFGAADGTHFTIPDLRGRAPFGKDDMGGSAASRITNGVSAIQGATLGGSGGDERSQSHTHTGTTSSDGNHSHTENAESLLDGAGLNNVIALVQNELVVGNDATSNTTSTNGAHTHTMTTDASGAGASQNMPPALILNYIIKT